MSAATGTATGAAEQVRPAHRGPTLAHRIWRLVAVYLPLAFLVAFFLMPLYVVLITGFKPNSEATPQSMWTLPTELDITAFRTAFDKLAPNMWNSVLLVVPASILSAMLGSVNGFVLARWRFRGANLIFVLILFGMFIPYQAILIPLVQVMQSIGLYGSIAGLILVHIIYGIPITTLTFRGFYSQIPYELVEAAKIDGASMWAVYRRIFLPLSPPGFVVVLIWQFTAVWNDFLFAVILTRSQTWPVTVALNNIAGSQIVQWNVQMAAAMLAAIPTVIVYLLLGRYFIRGMMAGALKG
jgi:glucose/mannose transport system permease protein